MAANHSNYISSARKRSTPSPQTPQSQIQLPPPHFLPTSHPSQEDEKSKTIFNFSSYSIWINRKGLFQSQKCIHYRINSRKRFLYNATGALFILCNLYFLICIKKNIRRDSQVVKPRSVAVLGDPKLLVIRLDVYAEKYPTKRQGFMSQDSLGRQDRIRNSKKFGTPEMESFITDQCKPMHDWQITSFPSCNKLHELGMHDSITNDDFVRIINYGFFRDVWTVHDSDHNRTPCALKTLRYEHDYIDRNYDRHRRDAIAMERLTSSPYIVDIFGYCGNNGIFEYSTGGDIDHALFTKRNLETPLMKYDRLRIAAQVANGISDAHYLDESGRPTIAHTDITGGQFIYIDGIFKLNDFNRARFLRRHAPTNNTCGFKVAANRGDFRAPEEYEYGVETEKVDVYSMGNILYQLATLNYNLFDDTDDDEVIQKKVMAKERPPFREKIGPNPDSIDQIFISAMEMCFTHDPMERPSARKVAKYIYKELNKIPDPYSNAPKESKE